METTESRFALAEFFLVLICCLALNIWPQLGGLALIVAGLPLIIRIFWSRISFRTTPFDPLIIFFLITSFVGLWVAYNAESALQKFYLIIGATLLFYSLANQPQKNLWFITLGLGVLGCFTTSIFLFTHDWSSSPADLGVINQISQYWTEIRPTINIEAVLDIQLFQANIVGGIDAILLPLCTVTASHFWQKGKKYFAGLSIIILLLLGLGLIFTSSRAAWVAVFLGFGILAVLNHGQFRNLLIANKYLIAAFPILIILVGIFVPLVLANNLAESTPITEVTSFRSRVQIARDTFFLITAFPFTGGGLGSFPGLYSQYILVIPFYMFGYSHNLYLDLAFEQGILGFSIWGCMVLFCAIMLYSTIKDQHLKSQNPLFATAIYASLIILLLHGIADDPIYSNTWGLSLFFLIPGLSTAISDPEKQFSKYTQRLFRMAIIGLVILAAPLIIFYKPILATWYANIGAINMAKVELENWPTGKWDDGSNASTYVQAESYFAKALSIQEKNRSANYRLGLVFMSRTDFQQAVGYLETSNLSAPEHRGTRKSLGYCYTWLGRFDEAEKILQQIPEAQTEMEAYASWWQMQSRNDLADNASQMAQRLSESGQ